MSHACSESMLGRVFLREDVTRDLGKESAPLPRHETIFCLRCSNDGCCRGSERDIDEMRL